MTNRALPLIRGVPSAAEHTLTPKARTHYISESEYCQHPAQPSTLGGRGKDPEPPVLSSGPSCWGCCPLLAAPGTQASGEQGEAAQVRRS